MQAVGVEVEHVEARSAARAFISQHEARLAEVESPAEAEALWRQASALEQAAKFALISKEMAVAMQRVRLRAERRWGELLPQPRPGGRTDLAQPAQGSNDASRDAKRRARQVAAVPAAVFDAYINQSAPDELTRAGLLAAADEKTRRDFEYQREQVATQNRGRRRRRGAAPWWHPSVRVSSKPRVHDDAWLEKQRRAESRPAGAELIALLVSLGRGDWSLDDPYPVGPRPGVMSDGRYDPKAHYQWEEFARRGLDLLVAKHDAIRVRLGGDGSGDTRSTGEVGTPPAAAS